ncbi:MAG: Gfo/Idh/MocA family oxidoreductase [Clostridia bacterium]|nr:Gfo/Idh/MocA family oxidoreductase [Oscillospiraceae bacterium]MBQ8276700.1 Gfo/Idh/MocA family oxidoreductase [Clostridia bacterium]
MEKIRVGIFGLNRGAAHIPALLGNNAEIVAVCDQRENLVDSVRKKLGDGVGYYANFDEFIEHGMDAVLLANYFPEHAPYAIRCLERNIHVLSECTAAATMADCVALVRAAEKSKAKYMLSENFPFMRFNVEIKRICDSGTLGQFRYAEGEYNHPTSGTDFTFIKRYRYFDHHWRHFLPKTYYSTHSFGPMMYFTGAEPVRVTALPICCPNDPTQRFYYLGRASDLGAVITTLNNDGSVFRVSAGYGAHNYAYRVCGSKGQVENVRGTDGKIMLRYNPWDKPEGVEEATQFYDSVWDDPDKEKIEKSGHGGGDFIVAREFLNAIRNDTTPVFDVYFATKMSATAILAHRSLLEKGMPYDVPDFRREEDRVKWENDTISPFWGADGSAPTIQCGSDPNFGPTEEQFRAFRRDIEGIVDDADEYAKPMEV